MNYVLITLLFAASCDVGSLVSIPSQFIIVDLGFQKCILTYDLSLIAAQALDVLKKVSVKVKSSTFPIMEDVSNLFLCYNASFKDMCVLYTLHYTQISQIDRSRHTKG